MKGCDRKRAVLLLFMIWTAAFARAASRQVRDDLGREIIVPDHPHRLICLAPNVADTVYAIGGGNEVIAVSDFTKYPAEARHKPSIGLPLSPSWETIVSLHPDLVIGSSDFGGLGMVSQMEQVGIPVFLVNPHGLEGDLQFGPQCRKRTQPRGRGGASGIRVSAAA